jgi:hypothetical protein
MSLTTIRGDKMKRALSLLLAALFVLSCNAYAGDVVAEPVLDMNTTAEPPPVTAVAARTAHKPTPRKHAARKPMAKHKATPRHIAKHSTRHAVAKRGAAMHTAVKHTTAKRAH